VAKIIGVDFSHWQANVNFEKLAANDVRFAIFKAGEIPTKSKSEFTDPQYKRNISEARKFNIISGAYYYFHPSMGASRQARHFDAVMQRDGQPDLPPVIDVEDTDQRTPVQVADVLKAMSDYMMDRGYRRPIIYSRWGFLVNQVGEPFWLKDHFLWLAQYSLNLTYKPADMCNVIMWQYTESLKLPGVGVALDGNYWLKSEEELLALVQKPPVEEPQQIIIEPEPEPAPQPEPTQDLEPGWVPEVPSSRPLDEMLPQPQPAEAEMPLAQEEQPAEPESTPPVAPSPVPDEVPTSFAQLVVPQPSTARINLWELVRKLIQAIIRSLGN
jgi:lysozyme